jgi:hypothetical protein
MTKIISFRVNSEQMEKLKENANRHGSSSIAEFVRDAGVNYMTYLVQAYEQGTTDLKNGRVKS